MTVDSNSPFRGSGRRSVEPYVPSETPEDGNSVDMRLDEVEESYVPKTGVELEGTIRAAESESITWHDTVSAVEFTEEPPIIIPSPDGDTLLGLAVSGNHLLVCASAGGDTPWKAIGFIDYATGVGFNNMIRFFSDDDFDTGFVSVETYMENRIGVGLGTNFVDVNFDNPSSSQVRWWFGTSGDYDFVPGKNNSYDIGEAARSVRNVYLGTGAYFAETSDPSAPAANSVVLFARDNGGKTELCARFPTGAIQRVAIEP